MHAVTASPRSRRSSSGRQQPTAGPVSASRHRVQQPTHTRTRSVRFPMEPVARDIQREMELELQRWVEPALTPVFTFNPSTRGTVSVRRCTTVNPERTVVLKTVAMTLPPNRAVPSTSGTRTGTAAAATAAAASFRSAPHGFSSTDLSSDLSGNLLHPSTASERDATTWSHAQLLPDASVALFQQVGRTLPHVAGVVDVFTLASMLRHGKARDEEQSGELVQVPKFTKSDMVEHGWTMAGTVGHLTAAAGGATPNSARKPYGGGGSSSSKNSSRSSSMRHVPAPAPPPHPTVFLYARDYVESYQSLTTLLEDRWGRDFLPLTVLPKWAHYAPMMGPSSSGGGGDGGAGAVSPLKPEEVRKLTDHVNRWLAGRAKAEKRKRRLAEQRAATATALHGSALAAPLREDPNRLTEHDAADLAWAIAGALEALHRAGLTHGNVKPNNVLVQPWNAEGNGGKDENDANNTTASTKRKACLTDHLLPLVPDALLEPDAVLSLPGWRSRETRGYACLKPHDATVLPHLFGGGPAGAPASDPAAYTLSGCWLSSVERDSNAAKGDGGAASEMTVDGGVEGLTSEAYEAVLLQHFVPPENVLLVRDDSAESTRTPYNAAASANPSSETYRIWVNLQNTTAATDVYALGVLLWVMLLGRLPPLPQYRRVLRCNGGGKSGAAAGVMVDHGSPLPPAYAEVLQSCVMSSYASPAGAGGESANTKSSHKVDRRLRELSVFLQSDVAQGHLPLVLALARARTTRITTMDLLVRLLHTDPKHRLTLSELRHHPFFCMYGSRRHELRRRYEETQRAAHLSTRQSVRAADGRVWMPRHMGALVGLPQTQDGQALERCRSAASTTATITESTNAKATAPVTGHKVEGRANSVRSVAAEGKGGTQGTSDGLHASPLSVRRSRTAHLLSPSPSHPTKANSFQASSSSLAEQRVDGAFGQERFEQTCFLGPASPSLTRRSSSGSSNRSTSLRKGDRPSSSGGGGGEEGKRASDKRRTTPSPAVPPHTNVLTAAAVAEGAVVAAGAHEGSPGNRSVSEKSSSTRLRTPSLSSAHTVASDAASPLVLPRTKTFKGARRLTTLRPMASVLSPLNVQEAEQLNGLDDSPSPLRFHVLGGATGEADVPRRMRETVHRTQHNDNADSAPVAAAPADTTNQSEKSEAVKSDRRGGGAEHVGLGERARLVLTPKASWVSDAPAAAPLLSLPSRRLAPLVVTAAAVTSASTPAGASEFETEQAASRYALKPRRPPVRTRPSN